MKNKLITALVALTLVLPVTAQAAEETKPATLAIIDTSLDTSLPIFKDKIAFEVCLLDWPTCPNGKTYQEGPGSVTMPAKFMLQEGFEHGTQMASTALITNPNLKIVFIRVVGSTASGSRQIINESTFVNALSWVLFNKDRFNIQAVSMSQSHHNLGAPGTNYCPSTPLTENVINKLSTAGVPVFLPAGNLRDLTRISWPACIASSVSISASAYGDGPAVYTNYDTKLTDFFARGDIKAFNPGGAKVNASGTSVSTQVAASVYLYLKSKNPTYTKDQVLSLLNTKSIPVVSRKTKGKILSIESVING
jgi:hypothetical protein